MQDLIAALRHNNAGDLADELQRVYNSWQHRRWFWCHRVLSWGAGGDGDTNVVSTVAW